MTKKHAKMMKLLSWIWGALRPVTAADMIKGLKWNSGAVYGVLVPLEHQRLVSSRWEDKKLADGLNRRLYEITEAGVEAVGDILHHPSKTTDEVRPGDVIWFQGHWRTVCAKDIKKGGSGVTVFGDSFALGTEPVFYLPSPPSSHCGYCKCPNCDATNQWRSDRLYALGSCIEPGFLGRCPKCDRKGAQRITKVCTDPAAIRKWEKELADGRRVSN